MRQVLRRRSLVHAHHKRDKAGPNSGESVLPLASLHACPIALKSGSSDMNAKTGLVTYYRLVLLRVHSV